MMLPRPIEIRGKIDENDLAHIRRLGIDAILAEPCPLGGNGVINPHVTRFHHRDGKNVTDVFHIKPVYYEALDGTWRPMSEVAVYHGNQNIVLKMGWGRMMSLRYFQWLTKRQRLFTGKDLVIEGLVMQPAYYEYATDSTFYPDPHAETTTVDGSSSKSSTSYSTAHDASVGEWADDSSAEQTMVQHQKVSITYYIARAFFLFNTSSIPDGDTISGAIMSYYAFNGLDNNSDSIECISTTPASNTALVTDDFDQVGSTSYGSTTHTGTGWHDITLNSTGIATISKTGVSKFGTRSAKDISNTTPTSTGYVGCRFSDYTGTTSDPKLVVTYTSATTVNSNFFAFM